MARDAGVKAAKYVIQQWPELFPARDFRPVCCKWSLKVLDFLLLQAIKARRHSEKEGYRSEDILQCIYLYHIISCVILKIVALVLLSKRNTYEALELFKWCYGVVRYFL